MFLFLLIMYGTPLPPDYVPPVPKYTSYKCVTYTELYDAFKAVKGVSNKQARRSAFFASQGKCYE